MMQRWSIRVTETLRAHFRRGALLVLAGVVAVVVTVSPLATKPASAAVFDFGLGGNSCAIETVGWVVCPTMRSIARLADYGFAYISQKSLAIHYDLLNSSGKTFQAWEVMRNIANGLFVVVFLYIIYGYLVGRTGSDYTIKRLLPRLMLTAIIVNTSFYIGVILVDISNIIGDSIWAIMKNIYGGNGSPVMPIGGSANPMNDGNLTKMTAQAMGNTGMVWALMPLIAAVDISIAVISASTVLLVIMREAVVAALIFTAPILIVLSILPNLEQLSSRAMRLFLQMLLLYPIIALLLGAGQIVSLAAGSWDSPTSFYGGGTMSIVPDMIAAAAAVLPLLAIWFIFKGMSSLMTSAGSRLSATVSSRGGKDDKEARVTGKATVGAAAVKNTSGITNQGSTGRRQAFSRNRRRKSLSGSSLPGSDSRAGQAVRQPAGVSAAAAAENSLNATNLANTTNNEDITKQEDEFQNTQIENTANNSANNSANTNLNTSNNLNTNNNLTIENAASTALAVGVAGQEKEKKKTAKDIFNNLNRSHDSKDKDRKFGAGPATGGGGGGQVVGTAQPTAPTVSYKAPSMAQSSNIVSGGAPAPQPAAVIAVPVQVDGSALLGQNQHLPPEMVTQPPISGTEEKAKARAQKYLFDADQDIKEASDKVDILGHGSDAPEEPPHTTSSNDNRPVEKDSDD